MLLSLAARHQENQQFDEWQRVLELAYAESRTVDDIGLRAYATCARALALTERGDPAQALALITGALPEVASNPAYAEYESGCRVFESIAARMAGDAPRGVVAARRAIALEEARPGVPTREIDAVAALAPALTKAFDYAAADEAYRRLDGMLESQGLGDTRRMAVNLNNWSWMILESGQMLKAVDVAARAVRVAALGRFRTRRLAHDADDLRGRALHDGQPRRGDSGLRRSAAEGSCGRLTAAVDQHVGARHRRGVRWR